MRDAKFEDCVKKRPREILGARSTRKETTRSLVIFKHSVEFKSVVPFGRHLVSVAVIFVIVDVKMCNYNKYTANNLKAS